MSDFVSNLKSVIGTFEDKVDFANHNVFSAIVKLGDSCPLQHKDKEYWWEEFVFSRYKPIIPKNEQKNDFWEQLQEVDPQYPFNYWKQRVSEVTNPLLKIQYSGLCWEYAKKENLLTPDICFAHISIDSVIKIAEKKMSKYSSCIIDKLEWSIEVALSIRDNQRTEKLRDVILC